MCCCLIEFDHHETSVDVLNFRITFSPRSVRIAHVKITYRTAAIPPAVAAVRGTIGASARVVVLVRSTEHHSVISVLCGRWSHQGITGVSSVPGHRQSVVVILVADGERRVLTRVTLVIGTTTDLYSRGQTFIKSNQIKSNLLKAEGPSGSLTLP